MNWGVSVAVACGVHDCGLAAVVGGRRGVRTLCNERVRVGCGWAPAIIAAGAGLPIRDVSCSRCDIPCARVALLAHRCQSQTSSVSCSRQRMCSQVESYACSTSPGNSTSKPTRSAPSCYDGNIFQNADSMDGQHPGGKPCECASHLKFFFVVTYQVALKVCTTPPQHGLRLRKHAYVLSVS